MTDYSSMYKPLRIFRFVGMDTHCWSDIAPLNATKMPLDYNQDYVIELSLLIKTKESAVKDQFVMLICLFHYLLFICQNVSTSRHSGDICLVSWCWSNKRFVQFRTYGLHVYIMLLVPQQLYILEFFFARSSWRCFRVCEACKK